MRQRLPVPKIPRITPPSIASVDFELRICSIGDVRADRDVRVVPAVFLRSRSYSCCAFFSAAAFALSAAACCWSIAAFCFAY